MSDATRRATFLAYFNDALKGDRELLTKRTRLSKGRITQIFDEREPFGERAAINLAKRLRLEADHFLRGVLPDSADGPAKVEAAPALTDEQQRLIRAYDALLPDQQRIVIADLELKARENREQWEQFQRKFGTNGVTADDRLDALKKWARPPQHELPIPHDPTPPKKRTRARK